MYQLMLQLMWDLQGSFSVCVQPMRDDVTICRLSLTGRICKMIPGYVLFNSVDEWMLPFIIYWWDTIHQSLFLCVHINSCLTLMYSYQMYHDWSGIVNVEKLGRKNVKINSQLQQCLGPVFVYDQHLEGRWGDGVSDGVSLRWRHNDHDSVSNHQPHGCLLNHLFRRRSKKTSKLRVTGLCAENSPETGEFPAQMASNAEKVSIWWRHHVVWGGGWGVMYSEEHWFSSKDHCTQLQATFSTFWPLIRDGDY